jgi:hypothetical protein
MPGKEVHELSPEEVYAVPDNHLEKLVDTVLGCQGKLHIDPQPRNVFYEPAKGFGILDLTPAEGPYKSRGDNPSAGRVLSELGADTFMSIGSFGKDAITNMTEEDYANEVVVDTANVDLLERYAAVVIAKLDGQDLADAQAILGAAIKHTHDRIARYSDTAWTSAQIQQRAAAAEYRRKVDAGEVKLDLPPDILD